MLLLNMDRSKKLNDGNRGGIENLLKEINLKGITNFFIYFFSHHFRDI
jgi:hypothetical protein